MGQLIIFADKVLTTKQNGTDYGYSTVSAEGFNEFRSSSLSFLKSSFGAENPFYQEFNKKAHEASDSGMSSFSLMP